MWTEAKERPMDRLSHASRISSNDLLSSTEQFHEFLNERRYLKNVTPDSILGTLQYMSLNGWKGPRPRPNKTQHSRARERGGHFAARNLPRLDMSRENLTVPRVDLTRT
jgi:hypothetical protein